MNNISYTVVTLDGKEKQNLSVEEIKNLFFSRQINQSSLVCSNENPQWQMLRRVFDLAQFIPAGNFQTPASPPPNNAENYQPSVNPFEEPAAFNQFSPDQPELSGNFAPNQNHGYTQNNQTPSLYQAQAPAAASYLPNPAGGFQPQRDNNASRAGGFSTALAAQNPFDRRGLRQAAVFLIVSAILSVVLLLIENMYAGSAAPAATDKFVPGKGKIIFSLLVDLYLAYKLWQRDGSESARKWVLVRCYLGFLLYGIIVPIAGFNQGEILLAALNFVVYLFFLLSIGLVLHGKESPSQSRVMIGMGTFAVYFLLVFGVTALSSIAVLAPRLGQFNLSSRIEEYKIEGSEFYDAKTGAKITLPEGWAMISTANPVMTTPTAKMIALQKQTGSMTMLDVVPVPATVDIKKTNTTELLEFMTTYMAQNYASELQKENPQFGTITSKEITRLTISVGTHPAKLLVMDTNMNGEKFRSHMVITFDELSMYVLHTWCPTTNYEKAKDEFYALEKSFSIPDQINSTFTQAAEKEKINSDSKSRN